MHLTCLRIRLRMPNVRPPCYDVLMTNNELTELDKAWADVYWTFEDNAFDMSGDHIGKYTAPVPFANTKYFNPWAEIPF